jgi:5-methyltetrahydropteroyltriglutamate--homocysteine methyltransferase
MKKREFLRGGAALALAAAATPALPATSNRITREEYDDYLARFQRKIALNADAWLDFVQAHGDDPAALPQRYARTLNEALRGRPEDMTVTIHTCRGNFKSAWVAEGGYDPVVEAMFSTDVDGWFMEFDNARAGGFEPLRALPEGKTVVLGLVTTKVGELESKDALKRRIDEAAKVVPLEQLALSPQCGFSSTHHGNALSVDDQWRKLELVVEVAQEVWGPA